MINNPAKEREGQKRVLQATADRMDHALRYITELDTVYSDLTWIVTTAMLRNTINDVKTEALSILATYAD